MRIAHVLIAAVLALPASAWAQPLTGPYVGFGSGVGFRPSELQRPSRDEPSSSAAPRFDPGAAETGSIGYGFGNGFRMEVEGMHQANGLAAPRLSGP